MPPKNPTSETEIITCLSVQQPHADAIFFDGKFVENRSWSTDYRGELWVCSSSKIDQEEIDFVREHEKYDLLANSPTGLLTGHILGRVNLVECATRDELWSAADDAALVVMKSPPIAIPIDNEKVDFLKKLLQKINPICWRHFCMSEFSWIFAEPQMLDKPIPLKGKRKLFTTEIEELRLTMASPRKKKWKSATE